ncbi:hypothetical protein ASZ90_004587 [hydrocarbon metagenome]|uniref:Uncharacterized protein n=1 Tax=hydrocarbon metagenome TaxID=938273 RepID=A0A0W8FXC8_9ZZZZ
MVILTQIQFGNSFEDVIKKIVLINFFNNSDNRNEDYSTE